MQLTVNTFLLKTYKEIRSKNNLTLFYFYIVTEDQEKLELKRLDVSNNKEQQQQQQQHLHTTQIVQQGGSPHASQEYFTPVLSVPSVSLPALPSLQVTSAGVQIEADISAGLQLTSTQSLQNPTLKNRLRAFEEGFRQGSIHFRECMQHISSDTFQPQLLLQSSQISKLPKRVAVTNVTEFSQQ